METLLIVDDMPQNLQVLYEMLKGRQYEILMAARGDQALEILKERCPDLILLDILMPGRNGIEVCRIVKSDPTRDHIPILFISALDDKEKLLQGLQAGAVDYISKPFKAAEVLAKIENHLSLVRLRKELDQRNAALVEQNEALNEALRQKSALIRIVGHDLTNPLSAVISLIPLAKTDPSVLDDIGHATQETLDLLRELVHIESLETEAGTPNLETCNLKNFIRFRVTGWEETARAKNQGIRVDVEDITVTIDPSMTWEILENFLSNAVKFSSPGTEISLTGKFDEKGDLIIEVGDQGPGLSETDLHGVFGKYRKLSAQPTGNEPSNGLGLYAAKLLAETMGGKVSARNNTKGGACFHLHLPQPTG